MIHRALPLVAALFLVSIPFVGASAAPPPDVSAGDAGPPSEALSATLFAGGSKAPPEDAWKAAARLSGIRRGREVAPNRCVATHVAEWVRVSCSEAGRVDLLAGETRDLTLSVTQGKAAGEFGNDLQAQFSMRPGDRRVIQWLAPDAWWSVWGGGTQASGTQVIGPMLGVMLQVDWASGPEPTLSMY